MNKNRYKSLIQNCSNSIDNNNTNNDDDTNDLFVFGYQCKLYRDNDKLRWINSGKHLIPWIGDHNIMIDRYDIRGYLNDSNDLNQRLRSYQIEHSEEDDEEFQMKLNHERFQDLINAEEEQENKNRSKGEYSNVGYSYNDRNSDNTSASNDSDNKIRQNDDEINDYQIPNDLKISNNIQLPPTMKLHQIIAKTASFVASQGLQMEILLKTKQSTNSNFEFLSMDSKLHPYYKHLLKEIKSGRYYYNDDKIETSTKNDESDDSADDSDDDYLHPSLLTTTNKASSESKSMQKVEIPNLFMKNINDNKQELSYSKLVKNFKDKFGDDIVDKKDENNSNDKNDQSIAVLKEHVDDVNISISKPPKDIELIIDKLAEHVAQNGEQFEQSIRGLNDSKFNFLLPGHCYNAYYVQRKIHFVARYKQKEREEKQSKMDKLDKTTANSIMFSMNKSKNDTNKPRVVKITDECVRKNLTNDQNDDSNDDDDQDEKKLNDTEKTPKPSTTKNLTEQEKRLQEFRKRKAQEFLKFLRNQNRLSIDDNCVTFGPNLPTENNDIELSPTIEKVTSPPLSPLYNSSDDDDELNDNQNIDKNSDNDNNEKQIELSKNKIDDKKEIFAQWNHRKVDNDNIKNRRYRKRSRSRSETRSRSRSSSSSESEHRRHSRHTRRSHKRSRSKSHERDYSRHSYHRSSSSSSHRHKHRSSSKHKRKSHRHRDHHSSSPTYSLSSRSSRSRSRSKSKSPRRRSSSSSSRRHSRHR